METAGINLWRQVSETLTEEIKAGTFKTHERLPNAEALAARFGVNRHTATKAVKHLESVGLVRIERGRGSYAVVNPIEMTLGARNWFEQNLRESNRTPSRTILGFHKMGAPAEVAEALKIKPAKPVLFVTILGEADNFPINLNVNYFPLERLPGIEDYFVKFGNTPTSSFSFTEMFKSLGVDDFRRKNIHIRSRPPSREETNHLKMSPNGHVLLTQVVQVDASGLPIAYAETSYSAGRVSFLIEMDP